MGKLKTETAHDIFRGEDPLEVFFAPKNVAVIGATEAAGSVGRATLWNLISSPFGGTVFPVNPKRPSVLGIKAYPSIKDVPAEVDLAVIVTVAKSVPGVLEECAKARVPAAIVISAGFQELGPEGEKLQEQVKAAAAAGGIRVLGPNCLGLMRPLTGLNASFAATMARPGSVGFISQSGALCTAVLDWSVEAQIGFSAFISCGAMVDVGWGDLIYYLGQDSRTRSILIYMETIGDARSFLSAAREVALQKPIIVIKAGRTWAGAKAAASHTGALTGSDEVLDAAFRRSGVLRVETMAELFYMADVLAKQPRPLGPRLTIVTNAGGPGVLATDALVAAGGQLAEVSPAAKAELNELLPAHWSHNNPVDLLGDASPERYAKAIEICAKDKASDGLLVILAPQAMTDPTRTAELLKPLASQRDKPVLASWMGGPDVEAGLKILNGAKIPTFPYPDTAARMFHNMYRYTYNLQGLYETPSLLEEDAPVERALVNALIDQARAEGRTLLSEAESKQVLQAYGIPAPDLRVAPNEDSAVSAAESLGFPVVVKLHSRTRSHKTDVGGVQLNVRSADQVRAAYRAIEAGAGADFHGVTVHPMISIPDSYELIVGSTLDDQFGPVLLFGAGGHMVEVFQDTALALPPLNSTLARRLMERTRIHKALTGVRGRPAVDLSAIEQLLCRFSQLVAEQRLIRDIEINPLLASPSGVLALDARIVLHPQPVQVKDLPRLAIRPYPRRYESTAVSKSGREVLIRPIRPEDEPRIIKFHATLSERTVYFRYLQMMNLSQRTAHERLIRICFIDYDRELALVATYGNDIVGVCRLHKIHGSKDAEFAIVISDDFQGQGLGKILLDRMIAVARQEGVEHVIADIHAENTPMQAIVRKLGFQIHRELGEPTVSAILTL